MSGLLLDTHVLLWWAGSPEAIKPQARLAIGSGHNSLLVSHASLWEMNIKRGVARLDTPENNGQLVRRARCDLLPISLEHIEEVTQLPHHHGDPFDRMLIAQARVENLTIITRDKEIQKYDVVTLAA